jgi:hypothetical protein
MEQRKRINAKQTAAGLWQIDATVEWTGSEIDNQTIAADQLALVKAVETAYRIDGRKLAGGAV